MAKGVTHTMKLTFLKSDLLNAINITLKAVPSKTTMPILECLLIEADDEIKITANDMELAIETKVKGNILEKGSAAIDAKLFSEIIRKLPDSEIVIDEKNENITISCEKANFNISGRRSDDFVHMPAIETEEHICVSQFTLKEIIRQTIFSIAPNENNKLMTGELFEVKDDNLKVVSLDGHRISIRNVQLKEHYENRKVVVPGKTLMEISRILPGDADKDVMIFFSKNHILFQFDQTLVLSRLIEGEYFKIDQMISSDFETKITVNKRELLDSINIVERIRTVLEETKMRPENLTLEVTESLAINDIGRMKKVLSKIKELGALIALDDFGTGYSSLSHIRELPIDIIKIDRCFVIDLGKDDYAETFVRMVAELADTIGVRMCVEGVEYDEQLQILKDMKKVQYIQGYYYDKPLTEEAFEKKYL